MRTLRLLIELIHELWVEWRRRKMARGQSDAQVPELLNVVLLLVE